MRKRRSDQTRTPPPLPSDKENGVTGEEVVQAEVPLMAEVPDQYGNTDGYVDYDTASASAMVESKKSQKEIKRKQNTH